MSVIDATNLQFPDNFVPAYSPRFPEKGVGGNTKSRNEKWEGNRPIAGLGGHFFGFGVDEFDSFAPKGIIGLRLGGLSK